MLRVIKDVYYCLYDEDKADGHVQKNKWMKTWKPEEAYDEDEDDDKYWYWIEKTVKYLFRKLLMQPYINMVRRWRS